MSGFSGFAARRRRIARFLTASIHNPSNVLRTMEIVREAEQKTAEAQAVAS
jgi:hypothetical protein